MAASSLDPHLRVYLTSRNGLCPSSISKSESYPVNAAFQEHLEGNRRFFWHRIPKQGILLQRGAFRVNDFTGKAFFCLFVCFYRFFIYKVLCLYVMIFFSKQNFLF